MALTLRKQKIRDAKEVPGPFNELQDELQVVTETLNRNPLVGGFFLRDVALTTTPVLVRHNLGFEPNGWLVLNKTASFDVYEDTTAANEDRKQFLALRTSAGSYTVNLLIF